MVFRTRIEGCPALRRPQACYGSGLRRSFGSRGHLDSSSPTSATKILHTSSPAGRGQQSRSISNFATRKASRMRQTTRRCCRSHSNTTSLCRLGRPLGSSRTSRSSHETVDPGDDSTASLLKSVSHVPGVSWQGDLKSGGIFEPKRSAEPNTSVVSPTHSLACLT